jgi:hypothetical protein
MISSLISLSKASIHETIPGLEYADYFVDPSENGIPSILHVNDSYYYKPSIDGPQDKIFVPSEQISLSIAHMYCSSQILYSPTQSPAFFAIPNETVTAKSIDNFKPLIEHSLQIQKNWFRALVQMADDDWQQLKRHRMISDIQRMAARELGLKREWLVVLPDEEVKKEECPFCGTGLLNPNAPICPTCGKIHNPVRFKELEQQYASVLGVNKTNEGRPASPVKP